MYKIKFKDLILVSNKKRISSNYKTIFFFYGMGNSSNDFNFLIKKLDKRYQLLIPELPGHNNDKFNSKFSLINFANSIVLFILRNNLCNLFFFSHSVGGIIPILIAKRIKQKKKIKKFFNYEGNLTEYDTDTITKKTLSYDIREFDEKFNNLIGICEKSNQSAIRLWSDSLKKTSSKAFYDLSKDTVLLSKKTILLQFFRIFFRRKLYMFGSNSLLNFSEFFFGSERLILKNTGHFAFYDDNTKFLSIFLKLIYNCK
jgi:esterase/lipase